ncbi:MAG TPA: Clp protease N-terminal domain-containing protein [Jatrophihabitans sp.]
MPKINVYLADDLAAAVKAAGIPVSSVCQHALADAVAAAGGPAASSGASSGMSRVTPRAEGAIEAARDSAGDRRARTVHLLAAIIGREPNLGLSVLKALDIEPDDVTDEVRALLRRDPDSVGDLDDVLPRAVEEAARLGHNHVGTEHLLIALASGPSDESVAATLTRMGASADALRTGVRTALAGWAHARETLTLSGLSAPIRAALDDIRQRLGRLEKT